MRWFSLWLFALLPLSAAERPNVVVILADDLGYGDLSCYGNERFQTPHIDRLAAEGLRFLDFHSNAPVCSPTRCGLLTGRYQQRAGIPGVIYAGFDENRHHGLFPRETTIAEVLREAGYRTGLLGKWHLGYLEKFNPIHHGFDFFRGYVSGNIDYHSHFDRLGVKDWWNGRQIADEPGYSTHLITRHAVEFIERHSQSGHGQDRNGGGRRREAPFFLYVAHEAPHSPWQGPQDPAFRVAGKNVPEQRSREFKERAYAEMVRELDRGVGEVVATLQRLDLAERTLVFFLSDNGANRYGSNGLLRGFKGSLWEGGIRVPAIAWWPGRIAAGKTSKDLATSLDLFPTILEVTGASKPDSLELDGESLLDLVTAGTSLGDRRVFWKYLEERAVRFGRWKLLWTGGHVDLFNLDSDAAETKNLAGEEPGRVQEMLQAYRQWEVDVSRGATPQPSGTFQSHGGE